MKIMPIVTGDRPYMAIGYKCNSGKVLLSITTGRYVSTDPGGIYLSQYPGTFMVFILTILLIIVYLEVISLALILYTHTTICTNMNNQQINVG